MLRILLVTTHPEGFLLFLRDFSFLCYATIHHAFEDPSKWDFEEGLTGLDLPGYMQLLSTCHARNALVLTPKYDEFFLQSALWAAAWMYRRSDTYIEGWRGYYTGLMIRVGSERLGIASARSVAEEVCPLLGIEYGAAQSVGWCASLDALVRTTLSLLGDPEKRDLVAEALAGVPG